MGFDIECIIDVHSCPGEYFCPVCHTLVYPNEALQSQCTHLYCKPCLAYVANNTRACPYDGYLVMEADSKPLLKSDKALAENIGKVKVRCLYHRSGCTWEGLLSECTLHCSGCAFGNSPVICNGCGIQIVHRRVHDHALNCPVVYEVQQATGAGHNVASSGSTALSAALNQSQASMQSGALNATASSLPGQDSRLSSHQTNASSQVPSAAPAAVPTPEQQWYQQQYQQYAGYALYKQAYQQYYPYHQAAVQQYQQHPHVPRQPQNQVYTEAPAQAQVQPQSQSEIQPQPQPLPIPSRPQPLQLVYLQAQAAQPQPLQMQVQPPGQAQLHAYVQPLAPRNLNQPQVNPQQQLHPPMQSHTQIPTQSNSTHGFTAPLSHHYNQVQPHPMQPQTQHAQVPQYHQLHPSQLQPHMLTQTPLQPQPHSQIQPQPQLQHHTPHLVMCPSQPSQPGALNAQPQSLHSSAYSVTGHESHPQLPTQQAQLGVPQQVHAHPTSGSLPPGQIQAQILGPPPSHRPPMPSQQEASFPSQIQVSGMPPAQHLQFSSQAAQQSHTIQQHPAIHPSQQSVPWQHVHQQSYPVLAHSQLHQHGHPPQQQPVQSQLRPQGQPHIVQQNPQAFLQPRQNVPVAPGLQPQQSQHYAGQPLMSSHGASLQSVSSAPSSGGFGSAAPVGPSQLGLHQLQTAYDQQLVQSGMNSTSGLLQKQGDQVFGKAPVVNEGGLSSLGVAAKVSNVHKADSIGAKGLKSEAGLSYEGEAAGETAPARLSGTLTKAARIEVPGGTDGCGRHIRKPRVNEDSTGHSLEHLLHGKSVDFLNKKDSLGGDHKEELESQNRQRSILQKAGHESLRSSIALHPSCCSPNFASKSDGFEKNKNPGGNQQTALSARDQLQQYRGDPKLHHHGPSTNQQKPAGSSVQPLPSPGPPPRAQIPGPKPTLVGPQGPEFLLHSRNPLNPNEQLQSPLLEQLSDGPLGGFPAPDTVPSVGRGPGHFGAPCGPPLPAIDQRDGIMGRAPLHASEGLFGLQHSGNPVEADMFQSQRPGHIDSDQPKQPGSFERDSVGRHSGGEPTALRLNAAPGFETPSLRLQDERLKTFPEGYLNPFSKEPTCPLDPSSRATSQGLNPHAALKFSSVSGGPPSRVLHPYHPSGRSQFHDARERELPVDIYDNSRGRGELNHTNQDFIVPVREDLGPPPHGFGNSSGGPRGREDNGGQEAQFFGYLHGGGLDASKRVRFGEHMAAGPHHDQFKRSNLFGQDIPPSHLWRGEFLGPVSSPGHRQLGDSTGFGSFPGHPWMGEPPAHGNLPPNLLFGESFVGNIPGVPHPGGPGFKSSFSGQVDVHPFDKSRKRKPVSIGWCRICNVDCETVDGLDVHSQTREHQKMAVDIVMSIKSENKKKQKASNDRAAREVSSKTRSAGLKGRGSKL